MYLRNLYFLISLFDPTHNTKSQSSLSVRSRNFCCPILKYDAASSKVKFAFSQKGISFILRTHLSDSCKSHVSSPFNLLSHIFNTQITESLSFSFLSDFLSPYIKDNRWIGKYYQVKSFFTSKRIFAVSSQEFHLRSFLWPAAQCSNAFKAGVSLSAITVLAQRFANPPFYIKFIARFL